MYAGAGISLLAWRQMQQLASADKQRREAPLGRRDVPWSAGAILFGGVAGPILLMWGLERITASSAALLLNLEGSSRRCWPGSSSTRISTDASSSA